MEPNLFQGASIGSIVIFSTSTLFLAALGSYAISVARRQGNIKSIKISWRGITIEMAEPPQPPPALSQHRQKHLEHEDHRNKNPPEDLQRLGHADVVPHDRDQEEDEEKFDHG